MMFGSALYLAGLKKNPGTLVFTALFTMMVNSEHYDLTYQPISQDKSTNNGGNHIVSDFDDFWYADWFLEVIRENIFFNFFTRPGGSLRGGEVFDPRECG